MISYLRLPQSLHGLTFDDFWNFDYFLNFDNLLDLHILRYFYVSLLRNLHSDLDYFLYRDLYYLLSIDRLFDYFFSFDNFLNNFLDRNFHKFFLDNFYLDFLVYIDWGLNNYLYWNLDLYVLIDLDLHVPGDLYFSDDCPLIRDFDLLDNFYLLLDDSLNRDLNNLVSEDRDVYVLVDNFLNIFLDRVRNLDNLLDRDFLDLVHMDLLVYVDCHGYLLVPLDNFLNSDRNLDYLVHIDRLLYNNLSWNFDKFFKFYLFFNLDYPGDFYYNVFVVVYRDVYHGLKLLLVILGDFVLDFLLYYDLSCHRDFDNYLIFYDLSFMRSNH